MPKVIHFEIHADDTARAVEFYNKVFGWEAKKWEGPFDYWLLKTGEEEDPGIDGAITERIENMSIEIVIEVEDIDEYLKRIEEAGGEIVQPKSEIPDVGYAAYFMDTEGNIIGLFQGK